MKTIKVRITSEQGSGKSKIMKRIVKSLKKRGYTPYRAPYSHVVPDDGDEDVVQVSNGKNIVRVSTSNDF